MRRIISVLAVMAVVAAMVAVMAMPAFAQGQVERGPEHARSICSFSGLNDEFAEGDVSAPRTQSYGQLVKQGEIEPSAVKSGPPSPGFFCNPNNLSLK